MTQCTDEPMRRFGAGLFPEQGRMRRSGEDVWVAVGSHFDAEVSPFSFPLLVVSDGGLSSGGRSPAGLSGRSTGGGWTSNRPFFFQETILVLTPSSIGARSFALITY